MRASSVTVTVVICAVAQRPTRGRAEGRDARVEDVKREREKRKLKRGWNAFPHLGCGKLLNRQICSESNNDSVTKGAKKCWDRSKLKTRYLLGAKRENLVHDMAHRLS